MRRREFIALFGSALASSSEVRSQSAHQLRRIGFLSAAAPTAAMLNALREGLRERGYVEGGNISIEVRWSQGPLSELPALATELVRSNVAVLVTWATPATLAARDATLTIPIVMFGTADPVATGLITSLARPGGNITGVANLARDLSAKQVELFASAVPTLRHIGIVHNPSPIGMNLLMREAENAVRALGREVQVLEARSPEQFETAFSRLATEKDAGAVVLPDPSVIEHGRKIAELAQRNRLPTAFQRRESVEAGGLVAYGPLLIGQVRQAAQYVDKIIKGMMPADLPVEQPTKFELVINLKTAKALGLTIPSTLLARADEVIE